MHILASHANVTRHKNGSLRDCQLFPVMSGPRIPGPRLPRRYNRPVTSSPLLLTPIGTGIAASSPTSLTFEYRGLGEHPQLSDYRETWEHQRAIHAAVSTGVRPGHVVFVEHTPVYTAGRRTQSHERPLDGTPVIDVDRGGRITYHGPGQLVGYPIVRLRDGVGVVDHVRLLEAAVIAMLGAKGLVTMRIAGRTGVWLAADGARPDRKICAIGVRVVARTAMHGFALNVHPSKEHFANIVPCGIPDAGVTSLEEELPGQWSVAGIAHDLEPFLREALVPEALISPMVCDPASTEEQVNSSP